MSLMAILQVIALALWLFIIWADRRNRRALRARLLELADLDAQRREIVLDVIGMRLRAFGDGVHDDTAAIQAAIDAAQTGAAGQ